MDERTNTSDKLFAVQTGSQRTKATAEALPSGRATPLFTGVVSLGECTGIQTFPISGRIHSRTLVGKQRPGPRVCIGKRFAMIETMIILSEIVRGFEILVVEQSPVAPKLAVLTRPKKEVVMSVEPFLPALGTNNPSFVALVVPLRPPRDLAIAPAATSPPFEKGLA